MSTVFERLAPGARVAVIRLRSLGDCVLTTPAISLLKQARPDLRIAVVVEDAFAPIFTGNPDIERLLRPSVSEIYRFRPHLALNFHGGATSVRLTLASRAPLRAGFAHFRFKPIYNIHIPRAQEILNVDRKVHTAEHLASAMFFLGLQPPNSDVGRTPWSAADALVGLVRKSTTSEERVQGDPRGPGGPPHLLSNGVTIGLRPAKGDEDAERGSECGSPLPSRDREGVGVVGTNVFKGAQSGPIPRARLFATQQTRPRPYAVLHPMASAPDKIWPHSNFLALADHMERLLGLEPIFISGPGESLQAFSRYTCFEGASLEEIKSLLAGASLFVGNDSGPAHMAAAFGLPVIVLFGSSDPDIWRPWQTESVVLTAAAGIQSIGVTQAVQAIETVLVPQPTTHIPQPQ
jgi:ADP-heptose:LPS heptosyltransferase